MGRESPVWAAVLLLGCVVQGQDPQLVGQSAIGVLVGGAVGTISGSSAQVFSAAQPSQADAVTFLWSGMAGGFLTAYRMKNTKENRDMLKPSHERIEKLRDGFHTGMVAGAVAGGLGQVLCGSSDEGGSSASSGSSSSSSNAPVNDNAVTLAEKAPNSLQTSGQMPILAAAFAGGMAGAIVSFFEPEILVFSGLVGSKIIETGETAGHHSKQLHRQALKHSKTAAKHLDNVRGHIVERTKDAIDNWNDPDEIKKREEVMRGVHASLTDAFKMPTLDINAATAQIPTLGIQPPTADRIVSGLSSATKVATNIFNRGTAIVNSALYARLMPLEGYQQAKDGETLVAGAREPQKKIFEIGAGRANVCLPAVSDDPSVPANVAMKCAAGVIKNIKGEPTFGPKLEKFEEFLKQCLDKAECDVGVCTETDCPVPGCDEMVTHGGQKVRRNKYVMFECVQ